MLLTSKGGRHLFFRRKTILAFYCFSAHQGLQGLAKAILNVSMTKDKQIRCGDWEAEVMSEDQVYLLTLVMLNVFICYTPSQLLSCYHAIFQI